MKRITLFFLGYGLTLLGYAQVSNTAITQTSSVASVIPFLGNYKVTFVGLVGGAYEPTGSIIIGTTTGIVPFLLDGNITLSESEPGVINVPEGTTIAGIAPEEIIYGMAVIQNPIQVFIGTEEATRTGDFGLFSEWRFGIPGNPNQIFYEECIGEGPFDCVPMFLHRFTPSGQSVNLVYFTVSVNGNADSVIIKGILHDSHSSEAAVSNTFSVPVESPILGSLNDIFMLNVLSSYEIVIKGNRISGWIKGAGYSVPGLAPQEAILEVEFEGTKENTTDVENQRDSDFFVFPNPTEGKFQIKASPLSAHGNLKAEVYSVLNSKVVACDLSSFPCEIDLSGQKKGIYLLRIFNNKTDILKRIVLQ